MPFLWKHIKQLFNLFISPSPKHDMSSNISGASIEKVSLFTSPRAKVSAAMTVEAAIVLPLFLFFFVNLGCAIEMIRLHGNLELALWDTGNKVCLYGAALGNEEALKDSDLAGLALSYIYVKSEVAHYAGEKYLEESPLTHGVSGLQFWESDLPQSDDTVDILMTYQVSPWMKVPEVLSFRMQNRYYGHLWTGYRLSGTSEGTEELGEDLVYVAENASVYHESRECTHLRLTISEVTLEAAKAMRSEYGARYRECEKCRGDPFRGTVFIGKEGDCYHYSRGCSGLKRTVYTMRRQEAEKKYRPCSRCGRK